MKRTIQVLISFEVEGEHTDADVDTLLYAAYAQFDDPRDADGERVGFDVRMIGAEWEEAQA